MWAAHYVGYEKPRTWINSGGLGTMGFAVPAAMGAKVGMPDSTVWAIDGDGCFQMTNQELATCAINDIPIKVAVINNESLGMVRQWQTLFYNSRYSNTDLESKRIPDFVKLAEAYGCVGLACDSAEDVDATINKAMEINDVPVVVDFRVHRDAMVWPMVAAGTSNDFCRVTATLTPSNDSDIRMEVWLPVTGWNGNFQPAGNGGWGGTISYGDLAGMLLDGFATAGSDTGHSGDFSGASFALGHPEKLTDFGYRAFQETTVKAKAMIAAFYGSGPSSPRRPWTWTRGARTRARRTGSSRQRRFSATIRTSGFARFSPSAAATSRARSRRNDRAIQVDSRDYRHFVSRGNVYFLDADFPSAIRDYRAAADRAPDAPEIHYNLALALGEAYDFPGQRAAVARARQLDPQRVRQWTENPTLQRVIAPSYGLDRARGRVERWNAQARSRRLPGHAAPYRIEQVLLSPLVGPWAALLLGVLIARNRTRMPPSEPCARCGAAYCGYCKRYGDPPLYCATCVRLHLRREDAGIQAHVAQADEVRRRTRSDNRVCRLLSLLLPGTHRFFTERSRRRAPSCCSSFSSPSRPSSSDTASSIHGSSPWRDGG